MATLDSMARTLLWQELVTGFASCDELKAIADKKATSVSHYGSVLKQPVVADLTMDRPTYLATVATTFNAHPELLQAAREIHFLAVHRLAHHRHTARKRRRRQR